MTNLILATSEQNYSALLMLGLKDFDITTIVRDKIKSDGKSDGINALRENVLRVKPQFLLLDFELLGLDGVMSLRKLCAETKVVIIGDGISEEVEWLMLKAGIRGCCQGDIEPMLLKQVLIAVQKGELWVRRALTSRLIDEMGKTILSKVESYRAPLRLLSKLTQREYDIAVRVGCGETNKQIAQSCEITERTVKAHLTEIFLKMGLTDRLNLALVLAADNRVAGANSANLVSGGTRIKDRNSSGSKDRSPTYLVA